MFLLNLKIQMQLINLKKIIKIYIAELKQSLVFKENNFIGVCTFTYEKEAASTDNLIRNKINFKVIK